MIIRVGDRVKVINPEFIERVGYPLSFSAAKEWVRANCSQDFERLTAFGDSPFDIHRVDPWSGREEQRILSALAKLYQRHMGYGGRERTIHTRRIDEEAGRTYAVTQRKTVKTGLYYPPCNGYDDYEPGGLADERTHVLLCLGYDIGIGTENDFTFGKWIERCNVRSWKTT